MQVPNRAFPLNQKLNITPKLKRNHLNRPHLCKSLEGACNDSIAVIVAPPGYGKSSLVAEWHQGLLEKENNVVCHMRVTGHGDCEDVVTALASLAENLKEASKDVLETTTYCILETAQSLTHEQLTGVFNCVAMLRDAGVHVAITSSAWSYALLGLCTRTETSTLDKDALRFTREEAARYIKNNVDERVLDEYIDAVYDYTQGWPAGVCLLSIGTSLNVNTRSFARNKYIHGYYSSLVDSLCDAATAEFLLSTSYLDELKPGLCACVMHLEETPDSNPETQAAAMLNRVEQLGLFLHRETNDIDSVAHYEKPFKLWLQGVFAASQPSLVQKVNRAASNWYTKKGDDVQAIKHLLMSGDVMSNFEDVRIIAENRVQNRNTEGWLQWVSSLSRADVVANPAFDVLAGWFFIRNGQSREAAECAVAGKEALTNTAGPSEEESGLMHAHLQCIEAECLILDGKDGEYIEAFDNLLSQQTIADNISLRCVMTYSLAESLERTGSRTQSQQCYHEAIALSELCGDVYALGLSTYNLAKHCIDEGDLYKAEQMCRTNMKACTNPYRGLLYVLIAHIDILAFRMDEAKEALENANALLLDGNLDFKLDYCIALSIIDEYSGRLDAACSSMMHNVIFARQNQIHRRNVLVRLQIRWAYLLFRKGDYRRCRDVLDEIRQSVDAKTGDVMLTAETIRIRLALVDNDIPKARKIISSAMKAAQKNSCITRLTELRILESYLYKIAGESEKAFLCMSDAFDNGAQYGLTGLFIREGNAIVDILNESLSKRRLKRSTRRFCQDVLAHIDDSRLNRQSGKKATSLIKRDYLTEREQQILDLLNKGMSRREIANELHIAYNTVKVHVSHIYEKLGVDNKLDALHAAREPKGL